MWKLFKKQPKYGGVVGGLVNMLQNIPESFKITYNEKDTLYYYIASDHIAITYRTSDIRYLPIDIITYSPTEKDWIRHFLGVAELKYIHKYVEKWRNNNDHLLADKIEKLSPDAILSAAREYVEQCPEMALLSPNEEIRKYAERQMKSNPE